MADSIGVWSGILRGMETLRREKETIEERKRQEQLEIDEQMRQEGVKMQLERLSAALKGAQPTQEVFKTMEGTEGFEPKPQPVDMTTTLMNLLGVGGQPGAMGQIPSQEVTPRIKSLNVPLAGGGTASIEVPLSESQKKIQAKEKEEELIRTEKIKGLSSESAGKLTLSLQSIENLDKVRKTLFPKGTAASFERSTAIASNIPLGTAPIIGRLIPDAAPFHEKGQNVRRWMRTAIAGRQLIETGVAARPEETERIVSAFMANAASNPKSAFNAINELQDFFRTNTKIIDPKNIFSTGKFEIGQVIEKGNKKYKVTGFDSDGEPLVDEVR